MSRGLEEFRNMLDVLMGKERNEPLDGIREGKTVNFWDDEFCKNYLVDFCPHDLFPNTKSDLGPCNKVHSDQMKEAYEKFEGPEKERYAARYEADFLAFLESLIYQVDAKIRRGNLRIDAPLPSDQSIKFEDLPEDKKEKINELNAQISTYLKQAERAGMAGRIDEAEAVSKQVAALRRQVEKYHSHATPYEMYVQRDKSLRVCHICGAMQSAADSASRFESHVIGKQHIGFEKVRAFIEELEARRSERDEKRRLHESIKKQKGEGEDSPVQKREKGEEGQVDNEPARQDPFAQPSDRPADGRPHSSSSRPHSSSRRFDSRERGDDRRGDRRDYRDERDSRGGYDRGHSRGDRRDYRHRDDSPRRKSGFDRRSRSPPRDDYRSRGRY